MTSATSLDNLSTMPRYVTVLRGALRVGSDFLLDMRIARNEEGRFITVTGGQPSADTFPSIDEARARLDAPSFGEMTWEASLAPGDGEIACFMCGAAVPQRHEADERLCVVCVLEAVDAKGRVVRFSNENGFTVTVIETGEKHGHPECYVRGRKCRASGLRMGGILVAPW